MNHLLKPYDSVYSYMENEFTIQDFRKAHTCRGCSAQLRANLKDCEYCGNENPLYTGKPVQHKPTKLKTKNEPSFLEILLLSLAILYIFKILLRKE